LKPAVSVGLFVSPRDLFFLECEEESGPSWAQARCAGAIAVLKSHRLTAICRFPSRDCHDFAIASKFLLNIFFAVFLETRSKYALSQGLSSSGADVPAAHADRALHDKWIPAGGTSIRFNKSFNEYNSLNDIRDNFSRFFDEFHSKGMKIELKYTSNAKQVLFVVYLNLVLITFNSILVFTVVFRVK